MFTTLFYRFGIEFLFCLKMTVVPVLLAVLTWFLVTLTFLPNTFWLLYIFEIYDFVLESFYF